MFSDSDFELYFKEANKLYVSGKVCEAKEYYSKAIEINPEFADAYYNLGKCFEYENDIHEAVKNFNKAIEYKKEYKDILFDLGDKYFYKEEYDKALFYYINDIKTNPENKNKIMIYLKKSKIFIFEQNFKIITKGNTEKVRLITIIPDNYEKRQVIHDSDFSLKPTNILKDGEDKYVEYIIEDPTTDISIRINSKIELLRYDFNIASNNKDSVNLLNTKKLEYLTDEKYLEVNESLIQRVAKKLRSKNELETVRKTYEFVLKYMKYKYLQGPNKGALYALKHKGDDCSEYSDLFVTLCRANNIPARVVGGFTTGEGKQAWGHAWSEAYLDEYGWIPFDPTFDDTNGDKETITFENLENIYIYLQFKRNDKILNGWYSLYYEWWGDEVKIDYDVVIKNEPLDNYYYFYELIAAFKSSIDEYKDALDSLLKGKETFKKNKWEYAIVQYLTDEIDKEKLVEIAEDNNGKLAEAYCYIGYKNLFNKKESESRKYFKKCVEAGTLDFFEYLLAKSELINLE